MTPSNSNGSFFPMLASVDRFIPRDQVTTLTEGSYENLIRKLALVVSESSEKLFGRKVEVSLIGTFTGYGLAESVDGSVARFQFETSASGQVVLTAITPVRLTSLSMEDYVASQTRSTVDALLVGQVNEAYTALRPVLPMLTERTKIRPQQVVAEGVMESFTSDRPWKKYYTEKAGSIYGYVKESGIDPETLRLAPKFTRLYDGSISEQELNQYNTLVQSDFDHISTQYSQLATTVAESVKKLAAARDAQFMGEDFGVIRNFAEDFLSDLESTVRGFVEARQQVFEVGSFGGIYDAAAKELFKFQITGAFLRKIATAATDPG